MGCLKKVSKEVLKNGVQGFGGVLEVGALEDGSEASFQGEGGSWESPEPETSGGQEFRIQVVIVGQSGIKMSAMRGA